MRKRRFNLMESRFVNRKVSRPNASLAIETAENLKPLKQPVVFKWNPQRKFNLEAAKIKSKINKWQTNNYQSNVDYGDTLM
jgi:hypothetical protein